MGVALVAKRLVSLHEQLEHHSPRAARLMHTGILEVRIGLYCSWMICCRWLPLGTLLKAKGGAWCNTTMKEGGSYNGLNDYLKFGIVIFCDWRAEALG